MMATSGAINFSRVEWRHQVVGGRYRRVPDTPEGNRLSSATGVIDMHRSERWGVLHFSDRASDLLPLRPLHDWEQRLVLTDLIEAQRAWRQGHGRFTAVLSDLGFEHSGLTLEATSAQFIASLGQLSIDHEWRLGRIDDLG